MLVITTPDRMQLGRILLRYSTSSTFAVERPPVLAGEMPAQRAHRLADLRDVVHALGSNLGMTVVHGHDIALRD